MTDMPDEIWAWIDNHWSEKVTLPAHTITVRHGKEPITYIRADHDAERRRELIARLEGYNPPDRTIDEQRQIAVDIQDVLAYLREGIDQ